MQKVNPLELSIDFMKEQLIITGKEWQQTRNKEKMKDCLSLISAINELEERIHGKYITDITFVM